MPPNPAYAPQNIDLALLQDVREYYNSLKQTTATPDDNVTQRLITAVSTMMARYCSRQFLAQQYQETRNGRGEQAMTVKNPYIVAVQYVVVDTYSVPQAINSVAPSGSGNIQGGWLADDRLIYLRPGSVVGYLGQDYFSQGIMNVVLTYWAGWATPGQGANNITFPPGSWASANAYKAGQLIVDTNSNIEIVTVAGTSGGSAPAWNKTVGGATADGSGNLSWTNLGLSPAGGINPPGLPYDLQQACVELVLLATRQRPAIGLSATGVGPERLTYLVKSMTEAGQETLNRYRNLAYPLT